MPMVVTIIFGHGIDRSFWNFVETLHRQRQMTTPEKLQDTLTSTESKRRRRNWALTHSERMARFAALQATAWQALASNPIALAAFHQRNRRIRRQSQVQLLLLKLRSQKSTYE